MDINYEVTFSVIIPTFNSGKTIENCLRSILNQTYKQYEIIVVDGLSEDDTLTIVTSFDDKRIKVISEKDIGIYDAMNKGAKLAKGKWLLFLGSDDSLFNSEILQSVEKVVALNPRSKFVYGDVFTSTGVKERYNKYNWVKLLDRNICHQAIFYHHSLFEKKAYNLKYKVCADWDFNFKVFENKNRPVYMDKIIARFSLDGVSGNWQEHPEYLKYFADKKEVIARYKSKLYIAKYYLNKVLKKLSLT